MCCGSTEADGGDDGNDFVGRGMAGGGVDPRSDAWPTAEPPALGAHVPDDDGDLQRRRTDVSPADPDLSRLSMGLPSGGPGPSGRPDGQGLPENAAWVANMFNPVADIDDAVTGSEQFSQGVLGGDWEQAAGGLAAVAGAARDRRAWALQPVQGWHGRDQP